MRSSRALFTSHRAILIPGDGIGPEVAEAVQLVFKAAGAPIAFERHEAGVAAVQQHGEVLPKSTLDAIRETGLALKGPCMTPIGKGFSSVNVGLRKNLDLYAAIRPVRSLEGVKTRFSDVEVDLVVFRENVEGMYTGIESEVAPGVTTALKVATERGGRRIARAAFEYAKANGRKHVLAVHKANIMKITDGLFIRCAQEVSKDYPDIKYEEAIIDACCMRIVQDPSRFDVLLMPNLYGDIISDLCAGLVGGLGVTPGGNLGENDVGVFEAVHGSAPDIAGQGLANPLALLMSGTMMLNHVARTRGDTVAGQVALNIKAAYNEALKAGDKTADLGGKLSTISFAEAVAARLN